VPFIKRRKTPINEERMEGMGLIKNKSL